MNYYSTLVWLGLMTNIVLIVMTLSNKNFKKNIRKGFIITFICVMLGTTCEWTGEMINGQRFLLPYGLDIKIHMVVKLLELCIVPIMPVICSIMIFERKKEKNKIRTAIIVFLQLYVVMQIVAVVYGDFIFYVDANNVYHYSRWYGIYIFVFSISATYMFYNVIKFSKQYQNKNQIQLYAILVFIVVGTSIQLFDSSIKTCWLTVSIAATFIYNYYNGLIQWIDGLTNLLNQKSYRTYLEENSNTKFTLIIFDVNYFKVINDTYGHSFGDEILKVIGKIIKKTYRQYGRCYRIGGDEFAVIIEEEGFSDIEKINEAFIQALEETRKEIKELPHVSFGIATYNPETKDTCDISAIKEEADKNMYKYKEEYKKTHVLK